MDQLWAPWRLAYVVQPPSPKPGDDCFICRARDEQNDRDNLVVLRTRWSLVILNRFPYNNGHLLVAPLAHQPTLNDLTTDELLDTVQTVRRMTTVLSELLRPDGFNIGLNLGKVAGAGLPGHLHWHIVPRWNGDTNFMPVLSDTKVIVQSLDALWQLLTDRLTTLPPVSA